MVRDASHQPFLNFNHFGFARKQPSSEEELSLDTKNAHTTSYLPSPSDDNLSERPQRKYLPTPENETNEDDSVGQETFYSAENVTVELDGNEPPFVNGHAYGNGHAKIASNEEEDESYQPVVRTGRRDQRFVREMIFQTIPMLFLSLAGSVLAGEVLAKLKTWAVFIRVEELFILVPIIINLKGNLEMNLAARFSTSANIGELDIRSTRQTLVLGNMALLQVQALIVSLIAGLLSFLLGLTSRVGLIDSQSSDRGGYFECLLVLCASMLSTSISSAILGTFMCTLVIGSRRFHINPDNIATPLASSLGDLLTLIILGLISSAFLTFMSTFVSTVVFALLVGLIFVHVFLTLRNAYVQELLWSGWITLFAAMFISSGSGLLLETYIESYRGFGLVAAVLTGIVGNIGSIYVSRISTALHAAREERYVLVGFTLFLVSTPILCLFLIFLAVTDQVDVTLAFAIVYCVLTAVMVVLSLLLGYGIAVLLWRKGWDPDTHALPLVTSIIDGIGQVVLVIAFKLTQNVIPPPTLPPAVPPSDAVASAVVSGIVRGLL